MLWRASRSAQERTEPLGFFLTLFLLEAGDPEKCSPIRAETFLRAANSGMHVSISGARRSMGGPLDSAMASFELKLRERGIPRMVYARLNITPARMFDDVLINMFYPEQGETPKLTESETARITASNI
jgi:hypothetical protein